MTNNNWELVKLGDILNFKTGRLDSNAATLNGEYPFFTCSPETLSINSYAFDDEAVLLAGNNANGVFSVKYYIGKFNAYQRTYVITSKDRNLVSIRWLYFRIKHVTAELQKMSVGTATKFLTKKILDNFEIRLPTLIEQESIANILWSLQSQIDINIQINQTLESIAQAIFKSWFIDFDPVRAKIAAKQEGKDPELAAMCVISGKSEAELRQMAKEDFAELQATAALFPDELVGSELGEVPKGWDVKRFEDLLGTLESGTRPKGGVSGISEGIPSVGAENILGLGIYNYGKEKFVPYSFFEKMNKGKVQNYDVLLYKDGGKPGEFKPRVSMFGKGFPYEEFSINEHVFRIRSIKLGQFFLYFK
ncbi:restriction endonuclease subunit S, partial [Acinetobacter junii]|uniref:restriction endonuclease subunit S n=1 Tax=Acinetobacter junii TaxID=40215 RepID=UPI003862B2A7